jgi:hypothetical protein
MVLRNGIFVKYIITLFDSYVALFIMPRRLELAVEHIHSPMVPVIEPAPVRLTRSDVIAIASCDLC